MATRTDAIQITGTDDTSLRARGAKLMASALARLPAGAFRGRVAFFDDNGPKGGPAMRCALTVRVPFRPSIRVERRAETRRMALEAAFPALERRLKRYRERERTGKRHPKKYFAARRAQAG